MKQEIYQIEIELKKRLKYPYKWGKKQSDDFDKRTNFIYKVFYFDELVKKINQQFKQDNNYKSLANYALNRWYNFWSAMAVEKIFCSLPNVKPALNKYDKLVDFKINGIKFDHKTTVFPQAYNQSVQYAKNNTKDIVKWLYINQSQQQRQHYKNRLFIILHNSNGEHWKLKAEISLLEKYIINYVTNFSENSLTSLYRKNGDKILSDAIWIQE